MEPFITSNAIYLGAVGVQMMNMYHAALVIGILMSRNVYVWNASTGVLCHKLAGHSSAVNETAISTKSIIASGSSDKTIYVGELKH